MRYMLLIYDRESEWPKMKEADQQAMMAEYFAFTDSIQKSGNYIAGDALQPVATATTLRVREGKALTTDGPFAETREQLGGYYLVKAENLDQALAIAARIPSARSGSIEIRPVMEFDGP
ncbi:MAG: YciI family protein [Acidobacteria bacterium]|nr:YciI family protein [Acidobacteriota bacterium]